MGLNAPYVKYMFYIVLPFLWVKGLGVLLLKKLLGFMRRIHRYSDNTLVMSNSLLLKMAIEIVDLPIKIGDFPFRK